ncbi:MAG: phosphomannomutase/phosphoglucomutase [Lachnospiraceae bacterium]|nr:phosphomannomutase/phosphoglucomutase [Lachnospiraceae bacterium]
MGEQTFRQIFKSVQNGNDVRGAAIATDKEPRTLTVSLVQYIAAGFAQFLSQKLGKEEASLRIGMGHDSRITADDFMKAGAKGLSGCRVLDCGLITTPAMFQSTVLPASDFDGAIMLTASHLPFNRNGMKFFTKDGALSHADLDVILENAAALADRFGSPDPELRISADRLPAGAGSPEPFDMVTVYCDHMQGIIKEAVKAEDYDHPLSGLHIIVDSGNGASGFFAGRILEPLGADVSGSQFLEPDGTFPNHIPNPENGDAMKSVQEATLKSKADLGVIFDCDGDRGAVVFSDGTEVNRNTLIALLSVIVSESAPGSTVVTDSVTSDELGEFIEGKLGLKHLRFKRGYKNVIDKGVELNAAGEVCELAIETSGHGAFKENHFSDDGAYIAVKIICRMAQLLKEGRKIESLIADLKQPAESREVRYTINTEDFGSYGKQVLEDFRAFAEADPRFRIVEPNYEGIRIAFNDEEVKGWMLLRMSLHDPVMPMNLESEAAGGTDIIMARLEPFFAKYDKLTR